MNVSTKPSSISRLTANIGVELGGVDLRNGVTSDVLDLLRAAVASTMSSCSATSSSLPTSTPWSPGRSGRSNRHRCSWRPARLMRRGRCPPSRTPRRAHRPASRGTATSAGCVNRPPSGSSRPCSSRLPAATPSGRRTARFSTPSPHGSRSCASGPRCCTPSIPRCSRRSSATTAPRSPTASAASSPEPSTPSCDGIHGPTPAPVPVTAVRHPLRWTRRRRGPLLSDLHAMLDDPSVQLRWTWHDGDFVIWDESSTCHRALTDHYPQRRVMRRCTTSATR